MKRLVCMLAMLALLAGCANPAIDPPQEESSKQMMAGGMESVEVWELVLVNEQQPVDENFIPVLAEVQPGFQMDARAAPFMEEMLAAAAAQGVALQIVSAYRSYDKQLENFTAKTREHRRRGYSEQEAQEMTGRLIALPGTSEHQTGLAADIVTPAYQLLDDGYAKTQAAKWLLENAADFGFILRYPKDKTEMTGFDFEPWHYRYVGIEAARDIMLGGLCLEEYVE